MKIEYLALGAVLVVYLVVALAHAYLAPLTIGPDELAHYEYLNFIAEHGRLPLNKAEREQAGYKSDQPPLFHWLASLPASLVDISAPPFLKRVTDHERRQLIERTRHAWGLYNTEDELWPYRGEVLRWQVGRWVAVFFGAATVLATFYMARDVFALIAGSGGVSWVPALGAAALVVFTPRFALSGAMLNYETMQTFSSTLFLWVLLRLAAGTGVWPARQVEGSTPPLSLKNGSFRYGPEALLLGILAGLAISVKLSALILPVEIVAALWLIGRAHGWPWPIWGRRLLLAAAGVAAAAAWWFGFVIYRFNTIATDGLWTGLLRPLIAADPSDTTTNRLLSFLTGGQAGFTRAVENLEADPPWAWLKAFFRTFWVVGIESQQPLGIFGLGVALGLCLLAGAGLIVVWRQAEVRGAYLPRTRLVLLILLLHFSLAFVLPLIRYMTTLNLADTAQGRHVLFLAGPAFAVLLIWGLWAAVDRAAGLLNQAGRLPYRSLYLASLGPGIFLLLWSGTQLWTMTWAYNPLLPVRTLPVAQVELPAQANNTPLNEFVTLLSHQIELQPETGLLAVRLWQQAAAVSPADYLTELTLLDAKGAVRAEWLGYPAGGRYPTRAWDVGDIVRDTAWLPVGGLEPGDYKLKLTLLPAALADQTAQPAVHLELGPVTLAEGIEPVLIGQFPLSGDLNDAAAGAYTLWQAGQPVTQPQMFRYRETVLVTLTPPETPGEERSLAIVGPNGSETKAGQIFSPVRESESAALFIVGPEWPTGDYQLQITTTRPGGRKDEQQQAVRTGPLFSVIDRWERNFEEPPLAHRLEANFANQVKLLGYDLAANRAEPGGGIPVTFYWQGLDWMGEDYTIFTKLLAADQTVHGGRDRLPREGYRTLYWAPGEIVDDPFGVPVDNDAPDGVYYLNVGLYKLVNGQAYSLPLVQDGQLVEASSVNIGPIKVGEPPAGVTLAQAEPQISLDQPFGETPDLTLLGYDLTDEAGQPLQSPISTGLQSIKLKLYWRSEAILPTDYTTFVHLRNSAGETVAQKDQPPLQGAYPTSLWDPGEIIADEIILPLSSEFEGEYTLVVGLYDFKTGARLFTPGTAENSLTLRRLVLR